MPKQLNDIEFSHSNDRLIVKRKVLDVFRKHEQRKGAEESGGVLLGYVYKDRTEIIKATTPSKFDSFAKNFFIRSKIGAQRQINKAWKESNGVLIYLGEWHTHRETNPKPSDVDKRMIRKTVKETKMEINFLHLIIVGHDNTYWVGKQTERKLTELRAKPVNYQMSLQGALVLKQLIYI